MKTASSDMTILDVRQPKEYEIEHIPGAKLIPIADPGIRLGVKPNKIFEDTGLYTGPAGSLLVNEYF